MHDFTGATVLVFGGGAVGARKARRFAREARVVVVSPEFPETDYGAETGEGTVDLVRAAPTAEDVPEWVERAAPALVVAATDSGAINGAAEAAARDHGALVNRADESGGRDADSVVVPATVRDGPVTVSVSTGGRSPALSKHLRETIEAEVAEAGAMAELSGELRSALKSEGVTPETRRAALRAVVRDPGVWKALRVGKPKARQEAQRVIRNHRGDGT
jgi:precorrin-2 dehydrogenase/sirohydrochlorin ferrochelatase